MADPDVRIVHGEVVDPSGGPIQPPAGGSDGGRGSLAPPDPRADAGWLGGGHGRVEVRTFGVPRVPGGIAVWAGVILLALGLYLLFSAIYPPVAVAGSAIIAGIGVALVGAGLTRRRGTWSIYVGAIVLAGGLAGIGQAAGILPGGGWTTLAIGIALVGLGGYRSGRGAGARPLLYVGGALAIVGGIQAAGSVIPGFPTLGQLAVPVILAAVGGLVIARALRRP